MPVMWLPISDIPAEGREFSFDTEDFWKGLWSRFGVDYTPAAPLSATLRVARSEGGVVVSGSLTGAVRLACDRCTADVKMAVDGEFEVFAPLVSEAGPDEEADDEPLLRGEGETLELDAGQLLWEQFNLALPVKVLCDKECKGLCPECGADLNQGPCECAPEEDDPRLSVLRGLKVNR